MIPRSTRYWTLRTDRFANLPGERQPADRDNAIMKQSNHFLPFISSLRRLSIAALCGLFTIVWAMGTVGCDQFEDPVADGPDAPALSEGIGEENPAQPSVSRQYDVDPPQTSGAMEVDEAGDLDPVLGEPAFEFEEPAQ